MERCPVCRAKLKEAQHCPRCKADLSHVIAAIHSANDWLQQAIGYLLTKQWDNAEFALKSADNCRHTPLTAVLINFVSGMRLKNSADDDQVHDQLLTDLAQFGVFIDE